MAFDGVVLKSLIHEFNTKLLDLRIDKVYQPEKDEIVIFLRGYKEVYKLERKRNFFHITVADKACNYAVTKIVALNHKHKCDKCKHCVSYIEHSSAKEYKREEYDSGNAETEQNAITEKVGEREQEFAHICIVKLKRAK